MKNILRFIINIAVFLVSKLPLRIRIYIGRIGAYLLTPLFRRENMFIKLQSKIFLQKEVSAFKVYANIAQTFFEAFNLKDIKEKNISVYEPKGSVLSVIKDSTKPCIVLTAHSGNWELLASYFIKKGFKIATAARKLRFDIGQEIIEKIRSAYGIKTIWRGGKSGAKEILNEVNKKHLMAGLIDQHTRVTSINSLFFGHEVRVPLSLIKIAKKHDANIVVAFNFRESLTKYSFYLYLLDASLSEGEIALEYNKLLEEHIRKYPDQWVWFHKRWRVLNDKDLSRKEYLEHLNDLLKEKL